MSKDDTDFPSVFNRYLDLHNIVLPLENLVSYGIGYLDDYESAMVQGFLDFFTERLNKEWSLVFRSARCPDEW